jgi:hypothetical protein
VGGGARRPKELAAGKKLAKQLGHGNNRDWLGRRKWTSDMLFWKLMRDASDTQ